jgi:hypothetical protein
MRPFILLAVLPCLFACGDPASDDLGDALAREPACDPCSADSALVGVRAELTSRAHDVRGALVVVDDTTLALEDFSYDGGGLDVRAVVTATEDGLDSNDRIVLSEDLRRSGGYDGARLVFPMPDGLTVDDVGVFSIWCLPAAVSFGDAALVP